MKQISDELAKLGKEIESAKSTVAQLQGRKTEIVNRLKQEFNVSTLEEAQAMLDKMTVELTELENNITVDFKALKERFSW